MNLEELRAMNRQNFRQEAEDLLQDLDEALLQLEAKPQDLDFVNRIFRAMHTLKGSGATVGFKDLADFLHHVEDLFNAVRERKIPVNSALIDIGLQSCDVVRNYLSGQDESASAQALQPTASILARIQGLLPSATVPGEPSEEKPAPAPSVPTKICPWKIFQIQFRPHSNLFFSGTEPVMLLDELSTLGHARIQLLEQQIPTWENLNPEECFLAWNIQLVTKLEESAVREVFIFVEDDSDLQIRSIPFLEADHVPAEVYFDEETIKTFSLESEEHRQTIETKLLGLEKQPHDPANCQILFRSLHNLKGACQLLISESQIPLSSKHPLRWLAILGHAFESIVEQHRDEKLAFEQPVIQHLLETLDLFKQLLLAFHSGSCRVSPSQEILHKLKIAPQTIDSLVPHSPSPSAISPLIQTLSQSQPQDNFPSTVSISRPEAESSHQVGSQNRSIRVDTDKLDRLMRAAGELLVARNIFPLLASKVEGEPGLRSLSKEIKDAGVQISHIAEDLQASIMAIRMMPVKNVFQKFPRMVRDMSKNLGKEVDLILEGEETELDKTVLDQISDPLVHLVRNAVDHGIETTEIRRQKNKPEKGRVILRAYNNGSNVIIEIEDDGRGMDAQELKTKAVAKKLITEAQAESLSESQAYELIFHAGFSTAEKITDLSGRGVGMDVVRSNIRGLHGSVNIKSRLGAGSKMSMTLPTSLMVSKGILIQAKESEYIFPIESVVEMLKIPRDRIKQLPSGRVAQIREEIVPVVSFGEAIGEPEERGYFDNHRQPEFGLALVRAGRGTLGIMVDAFTNQVEVIVKPLQGGLAKLNIFQGATIMGDGRVVLVLNLKAL